MEVGGFSRLMNFGIETSTSTSDSHECCGNEHVKAVVMAALA